MEILDSAVSLVVFWFVATCVVMGAVVLLGVKPKSKLFGLLIWAAIICGWMTIYYYIELPSL